MATGMKSLDMHACTYLCTYLCWLYVVSNQCWALLSLACCFSIASVTGSVHTYQMSFVYSFRFLSASFFFVVVVCFFLFSNVPICRTKFHSGYVFVSVNEHRMTAQRVIIANYISVYKWNTNL